jgi:addiction module HigA family antidote
MSENIRNRYKPDYVSPPGETLLEVLKERGMSQAELSRRTGRPKKTINEIIQGKASITPETALQLERVLDVPASFWSNRQHQFDQHRARIMELEQFKKQMGWLQRFSYRKMIDLGWINKIPGRTMQLVELLRFFGVASPKQWELLYRRKYAVFRKSRAHASEIEDTSAWLRQGELIAHEISCRPYDAKSFRETLGDEIRSLTLEEPEVFQERLIKLCSNVGVAVAFTPQLPKARISGATRWLSPTKALIQLSLRYKTDDQLWFTFFHEAGHILLHGKRDLFLEANDNGMGGDKEREADSFAADLLIPRNKLRKFLSGQTPGRYPRIRSIEIFSEEIGIAPGIVVGRMQHDRLPKDNPLPFSHCNGLKRKLEWGEA